MTQSSVVETKRYKRWGAGDIEIPVERFPRVLIILDGVTTASIAASLNRHEDTTRVGLISTCCV